LKIFTFDLVGAGEDEDDLYLLRVDELVSNKTAGWLQLLLFFSKYLYDVVNNLTA
jgi:hypothetical protein